MPAQNVIRVVQQPNGARYNAPLAVQPIIEFGTLDNNVFTRDTTKNTGSVLVSEGFQGTNAGYDLTGTLTANFVNGLATFTNVGIVPDATNTTLDISPATLVFTSVGVNTISSAQFNISNASKLIRTSPSSTTTITALTNRPIRWPITVQLADNDGVAVPLSGVNVTVTANGATLSGVTTGSTNSNGNVTFSNLVLSAGTQATLTFSAVGITPYTVTIDISPVDIIKPKRSEVSGKTPTTVDLVEYEIAINIPDKKIFVRDSKDNIQVVASVDVPPVTSVAGKTGAVTLEINDLTDVDTTTAPTNNQTLVWNNSQSNWLPGNVVNSLTSSTLSISNSSGPTATVELSTISGISGTYNSSSKISPLTIDSYGRVSAVGSAVSLTPAWDNITGTPTTLAGYGITDAQPLDTDLTKIASLTQTNGLLKKTAADTWTLDTNTYLTGNQSITLSGDATGSGATSISVTLANSGVTAGNYTKVAVDSKGRVTSGSNPTTLSGYGITDASLNTHTHTFAELTSKPTTLSGYGITDSVVFSNDTRLTDARTPTAHTHPWSEITSKPTTLSGFGITDNVVLTNDSRLSDARTPLSHTQAWSTITSTPTTISGYGITDAVLTTDSRLSDARTPTAHTQAWSTITSTPTTLSGYGITNAVATSSLGVANGVATLDSNGLVPSTQLPSYVDDVLEYANLASFPVTGETSKIYVDIATTKIYRWSGSAYIEISPVAGTIDAATRLATPRTISLTTDVTGSVSFDGTANVSIATTLANSGVTAGTYNNVTVNSKGLITSGSSISYLTSNQNISITGDASGSGNTSITLTLANSGATAGTYKSVTVDAKGRVTSGTNPTTLAGYGITDAATSTHTHTFASLTSKPTTLSGYGITDAATATHTHTFASLTSKPTTLSGYGITDAYTTLQTYTKTEVDTLFSGLTIDWASITSIPTTLTGYGVYTEVVGIAQSEISSALPSASVSYANTAGDASTADYIAVTDDTAGVGSLYPLLTNANSGDVLVNTSSAALTFVPSTGTLSATKFSGSGASLTSLNASNISSGTLAIANGGTNNQAIPTAGGVAYGTGTKYAVTGAGTSGQLLQSNGTNAPSWINFSSVVPSGIIMPYSGPITQSVTNGILTTTAPSGWALCDGSAISRTTYSVLWNLFRNGGSTGYYGSGDLSTTFNLPDLRGNIPVGFKSTDGNFNTIGKTGGASTVTLDLTQIPGHTHSVTNGSNRTYWNNNGSQPWTFANTVSGYIGSDTNPTTSSAGGGASHNNLQPYLVLHYIIKL